MTHKRWIAGLVLTILVTLAGLGVAVQQFVVKYLIDNWAHPRTLPGVLCMLLGVAGICLPVLLIAKRKKFNALRPSRQWLAALGIPLSYVLGFLLLGEISLRSTTMILPRAETPTAIVGYKYGRVRIDFRTQKGRAGGFNHIETNNGVERFSASMEGAHSPRHGYLTSVVIRGQARKLENGTMQIDLDVDADEPIRFAVEDLELVKMTRDGQAMARSDSPSGKFRVTVVACAKSTGT